MAADALAAIEARDHPASDSEAELNDSDLSDLESAAGSSDVEEGAIFED